MNFTFSYESHFLQSPSSSNTWSPLRNPRAAVRALLDSHKASLARINELILEIHDQKLLKRKEKVNSFTAERFLNMSQEVLNTEVSRQQELRQWYGYLIQLSALLAKQGQRNVWMKMDNALRPSLSGQSHENLTKIYEWVVNLKGQILGNIDRERDILLPLLAISCVKHYFATTDMYVEETYFQVLIHWLSHSVLKSLKAESDQSQSVRESVMFFSFVNSRMKADLEQFKEHLYHAYGRDDACSTTTFTLFSRLNSNIGLLLEAKRCIYLSSACNFQQQLHNRLPLIEQLDQILLAMESLHTILRDCDDESATLHTALKIKYKKILELMKEHVEFEAKRLIPALKYSATVQRIKDMSRSHFSSTIVEKEARNIARRLVAMPLDKSCCVTDQDVASRLEEIRLESEADIQLSSKESRESLHDIIEGVGVMPGTGSRNKMQRFYTLKQIAATRGGSCLSEQFEKMKDKMTWKCAHSHVWNATAETIFRGYWCPECRKQNLRLSIHDMHETAALHGGRCLSQEYKGSNTKLLWECRLGHQFMMAPNNIRRKRGTSRLPSWCPQCSKLPPCQKCVFVKECDSAELPTR